MGTQELSEAGVFAVHIAAAHGIFAALVGLLLVHKTIGVLIQLFAHALVILQIGLQRRMVLQELLIFYKGRIATKLFCGFAMSIEEAIELCQFSATTIASTVCISVGITIAVLADVIILVVKTSRVLAAIVTLFLTHEGVWILRQIFAHSRMFLKKGLQCGVTLDELLILYERWVAAKLLGHLAMAVEKLIKPTNLLPAVVSFPCPL